MYLVLTALLALNVSKEVMDGYAVVNSGVVESNQDFADKLNLSFQKFEKNLQQNQIKVGPFYKKAEVARSKTETLVKYIEDLRDELIAVTEGIPLDSVKNLNTEEMRNRDNYTTPTRFLIGKNDDGSNGRANELKKKLILFKSEMIELINPKFRKQLKITLETEGDYKNTSGQKENWEVHHFYDIPLAADIPILNKFISDVKNAELEIIESLMQEIGANDYRYDQVSARILPKSNFLFTGENYEAELIVAAFDTTQNPMVYLMRGVDSLPATMKDKAEIIQGENGRLKFKIPAIKAGMEKFAGYVSVRNNSGEVNNYHFNSEYYVATPSLSVSATNMNVLYAGVSNPISLAAAGVSNNELIAEISAGSLKKDKNGNWVARVPSGMNRVSISISIKSEGKTKNLGKQLFRVKEVPDPIPYIALTKSGIMNKENLLIAARLTPRMPDDFEFDCNFNILSFSMTLQKGFNSMKFESKSDKITEEMLKEIKFSNRGQKLIFDEIVVSAPEGKVRTITPLIITLN